MAMYDDDLSGIQKAAILLISLGPEKSANILRSNSIGPQLLLINSHKTGYKICSLFAVKLIRLPSSVIEISPIDSRLRNSRDNKGAEKPVFLANSRK